MRSSRALALSLLVLAACGTNVESTNPYDPSSADPVPGSVRGRVVDVTASAAPGVRVFLEVEGREVTHGDTGEDGAFLLEGVAPGRYELAIRDERFYPLRIFGIEIALGRRVELGDLTLQSRSTGVDAGYIEGQAFFEGATDHGGIVVFARDTDFRDETLPSGAYSLAVVPGTYELLFSAPEWGSQGRAEIVVAAGQTVVLEPVTLTRSPATITGVVHRRSCTADPGAAPEPAEGAIVAAVGSGAAALTDAQGRFSLTGLPGGTWAVRATLDGQDAGTSLPVTVRGGETVELPEVLVLAPALGAVVGHVRLTDRVDHAGTIVQLRGVEDATAVTSESGAFRISDICAGEGYALTARATQDGFLPANLSGITVRSGEDSTPVELLLAPQQGGLVLAGGRTSVRTTVVDYVLPSTAAPTQMRLSETEFVDAEADWQPYRESGTFTLQDLDGARTVFAQVRGAGGPSALLQATVVLDRVAPQAPVVELEGGGAYSNDPDGSVVLTLTATDAAIAPVDRTSGLSSVKLLNHELQGGGAAPSDPADARWDDPALVPTLPYQRTLEHALLRPNEDGEKELWVRFGDEAGNWSTPTSAGVILDREAPDGAAVEIVTATPGLVNDARVTLLLTATDEHPGVQVRIAGSSSFQGAVLRELPAPPTLAWDLPQADGPQTVWVQYADLAGNLGPPLSASIELDTRGPTGVRLAITEAPYARSPDVELALLAQGAAEMRFSLAPDFTDAAGAPEAWLPFAPTQPFTLQAGDGPQVVYARFRDEAHNESITLSTTVTLDTVAPVAAAIELLEGDAVASPDVTLAVTALPGPLDAYELRVDVQASPPAGVITPGAWQPFQPTVPVTLPASDGEKELQLWLRDAAGNVSVSAATAPVTLDRTPPMLVSAAIDGGATFTRETAVVLTVDALGADEVLLSNRADFLGASWQPLVDPAIPWTLPTTDGAHTVFVRLRDRAGNELDGQASITLDRTAPQPVSVSIDGGAAYTDALSVDLLLSASDALSGVVLAEVDTEETFAGATVVPWGGAGTEALAAFALQPQEGAQAVHVRFHDAAGNVALAAASIRVDTEAPAGTLAIDGGAAFSQDASVTLSLAAPADASTMRVIDGDVASCAPPLQPFSSTVAWTLPGADGAKAISVCFVDGAGNTSTATASITLDTQSPAGTLLIDGGAPYATSRTVLLTLAAAPDATEVALANAASLDCATASWEPLTSPRTWTLTAGEGARSVAACFRDGAGRTAGTSAAIVVDTSAPTGAVQLDAGATWSRDSTVDLTLTAADPAGSGVAYADVALDPSFSAAQRVVWGGQPSQSLAGVALIAGDGPRTVYVRYTDVAGNHLDVAATIVVDTAAPVGSIALAGGAAYTQSALVTVTLAAPADTQRMRLVDGGTPDCGAPLVPYAASASRTLPGADGEQQLSVCFEDAAGNTATATASIVLDTSNPAGTVSIDGGATVTPTRDVTLTFTGPSDVAQLSIANAASLDCTTAVYEGFQAQKGWTLTNGDGPKDLAVCFKDLAGRTASTTAAITLDTTFPSATLSLAAGATYATTATVAAALTFSTEVTGWAIANDALDCSRAVFTAISNQPGITVAAHALSAGEGSKSVVACVRDAAGNVSQASDSIVLDTEAPTAGQLTLSPAVRTASDTVTAVLFASGATEMCLDGDIVGGSSDACVGNGWTSLLASTTVRLSAGDGLKQVDAFFRDAAGNVAAVASDTITLDATAPSVSSFSLYGLGRGGASSTVTRIPSVVAQLVGWSDAGTGIVELQLSESAVFAGAAWQTAATSVPFTLSGDDATKTVYARARDAAGNQSATVFGTIELDQTPPSGGELSLAGGAAYTNAPAPHTIAWKFSVDGAAVQWSPTGTGGWTDCVPSPCASDEPGQTINRNLETGDGQKRVALFFRDAAGNVSDRVEDTIYLDTTTPGGVRILSAAPRTTSIYVDLDDSTDTAPGVVDHYEVEVKDFRNQAQTFSFPVSEGWLTGLPALKEYTLRSRAVDAAGNGSPWLPAETPQDPPVRALVGLTPTVVEGVDAVPLASQILSVRGISFFPSGINTGFRLMSCDSRRGPCAESGFRSSTRDPLNYGSRGEVAMAVQGERLFYFGLRSGGGQLEMMTSTNFDTAWDLGSWTHATLQGITGTVEPGTLTAASNGKLLAVAWADNTSAIQVMTCPLSRPCTEAMDWSMPTAIVTGAETDFRRELSTSLSMDAGENHLWISYPANDGTPCVGGNSVCGVAVLGCAISENATRCTAPTDWNKVRLVNGGGFPRSSRVIEAEGYLWVAGLLEPDFGAPPPEDGLWLWRCGVTQSPTSDLCASAANFGAPELLQPLSQVIEGSPGVRPRVAFEAWGGSIYFGTFDYGSLELTFGRCSEAQTNCFQKSGTDLVNFNRATVVRAATNDGEAKLGIHQGNPVLFLRRDFQRVYVVEPYTAAPIGRALVPDMSTGGVWATWLDRDAASTDGYRVSYDAATRTLPAFDEQITTYSTTDTSLDVSSVAGTDHWGIVGAFRGRDQSLGEPVFHARGGERIEDAAILQPGAGPRYAASGSCHAVVWANQDGSVQLSTCRKGGACDTAAGWNDQTIEAARAGNVTVEDVAVAIDPSSTRVHVAFAYAGEPEELWYSWRSLNATCVPGAAVNELKLLDGAGTPSPEIKPTRLTMLATDTRLFLAYARHPAPHAGEAMGMGLGSCATASGCLALGDWSNATFDLRYGGGALAVVGTDLYWATQTSFASLSSPYDAELRRCALASRCDEPADFTAPHRVFTSPANAGPKASMLLRSEEGRLLYSWGDDFAWCNEGGVACDAPEAWNRGWFSPDLLSQARPKIVLVGSVGNGPGGPVGSLSVLSLGNEGHGLARCTGRCWNPDSFLGGWSQLDGSTQYELSGTAYHFGQVGEMAAGVVTVVTRSYDAVANRHHWVFHDGVFLDVSQ